MFPERAERMIVLGCGAAATAEQIALCAVQARAIRLDPGFRGGDYYDLPPGQGPAAGLGLARRIGHISYRSEIELHARFGRGSQDDEDPLNAGRYAIESYLDHQAVKLARRFDANSYLVLSRAMDHHDVARGRGRLADVLAGVQARATIVAIDSDRLYPPRLQKELCANLPGRQELDVVTSPFGHDAFLIESEQVGKYIRKGLDG
jgi:homoserine O-acetyltransferase